MNLADFRQRVAFAIGASTSNSNELDLIDDWVNEAVVQFLLEAKVNVVTASLGVTAGSGDYTLDTDILSMTDLWYEPANGIQNVVLEPLDSREIQRLRRQQTAADVGPRYYAMQGAHLLMLYPLPASSSDTLHILYTPRPSDVISATAHSPADATRGNIPEEYHPLLEAYVKWKGGEAFEHKPSEYGLNFQAEWERGLAKTRANINRKSGVFRGRKRAGRRPLFPLTPGTDLR